MRFLCLHGSGTNSEIFEAQTAALRYQVRGNHTYEFVDGSLLWPAASGIEAVYGRQEECYRYLDPLSATSIRRAIEDLRLWIAADGPFDGIIAFSQGAGLAATMIIQDAAAADPQFQPIFKCAIFFSSILPCDPEMLGSGKVRALDPEVDGEVITIPTAHIWGSNDFEVAGASSKLAKLCKAKCRVEVIHDGGHEIPALKGSLLEQMADAFTETVESALQ